VDRLDYVLLKRTKVLRFCSVLFWVRHHSRETSLVCAAIRSSSLQHSGGWSKKATYISVGHRQRDADLCRSLISIS